MERRGGLTARPGGKERETRGADADRWKGNRPLGYTRAGMPCVGEKKTCERVQWKRQAVNVKIFPKSFRLGPFARLGWHI